MFACDPEFVFTERMKITMGKEAFLMVSRNGTRIQAVSSLFDEAINNKEPCKYCKVCP
jgi:hypothetical protein